MAADVDEESNLLFGTAPVLNDAPWRPPTTTTLMSSFKMLSVVSLPRPSLAKDAVPHHPPASRIPPKARLADIKPTVARLASLAYERGLLPDALVELVDLVAVPSLLDQASLNALVRNLYPRDKVSRSVVLRAVAALGHGALKPSLNLQAGLLRWLVMVFHVLEDRVVLARAYPVLFNLLDTAAIRYFHLVFFGVAFASYLTYGFDRPQLAQLLALVTRRRHVRPFRIQAL